MNGFINLLKPPGMSSASVVALAKQGLPRGSRVGHMGTLDPAAAGVLPVAVGQANRLFDYVSGSGKIYLFEITLGVRTDTQDQTGSVTAASALIPSKEALQAALPSLTGKIIQRPSVYSALKQDGKPLYALARSGVSVEVPTREVEIYALRYVAQTAENRHLLRVACQGGTYVRSICDDLGQMLGCGAHVSFLLREKSGFFTLDQALTPKEYLAYKERGEEVPLLAMDAPLAHMDAFILPLSQHKRVRNGQSIPLKRVEGFRKGQAPFSADVSLDSQGPNNEGLSKDRLIQAFPFEEDWEGKRVCVYLENRFAGICRIEKGFLVFQAMLLEKEENLERGSKKA